MKINLKNGGFLSVSKEFPMNVLEIQDTLDRLKIPDDKPIVEFSISEYDNMELPYTLCRREFSADIYRLNLFAERLGNLKATPHISQPSKRNMKKHSAESRVHIIMFNFMFTGHTESD